MDERKSAKERRLGRVPRRQDLHLLPEPEKGREVRGMSKAAFFSILLNIVLAVIIAFLVNYGNEASKTLGTKIEALETANRGLRSDLQAVHATSGSKDKEREKWEHRTRWARWLLNQDQPWEAKRYLNEELAK